MGNQPNPDLPMPTATQNAGRRVFHFVTGGLLLFLATYGLYAPSWHHTPIILSLYGIEIGFLLVIVGKFLSNKDRVPPERTVRNLLLAAAIFIAIGLAGMALRGKFDSPDFWTSGVAFLLLALFVRLRLLVL